MVSRILSNWNLATAGVLLVAVGLGAQEPATAPTPPADLVGIWNLDRQASDDLQDALKPLLEALRGQSGATGRDDRDGPEDELGAADDRGYASGKSEPGRPGGVHVGGGPDGAGGGEPDTAARDGGRDLAMAMNQLLITVDGANIEIMDGTDRTRVWTPDGNPRTRPGPGGKEVRDRAWWDGATLVLESAGGPLQVTRRLHRSEDGHQMIADVVVTSPGIVGQARASLVYRDVP